MTNRVAVQQDTTTKAAEKAAEKAVQQDTTTKAAEKAATEKAVQQDTTTKTAPAIKATATKVEVQQYTTATAPATAPATVTAAEAEQISQEELSTGLKQFINTDTGSDFIIEIIKNQKMSDNTELNAEIEEKLKKFNVVITSDTIGIKFNNPLPTSVRGGGGGGVLVIGGAPPRNNISLTLLILGSILIPISERKIMSIVKRQPKPYEKQLEELNRVLELKTNQDLKKKLEKIDELIDKYYRSNTDMLAKELKKEGIILKTEGCSISRSYY